MSSFKRQIISAMVRIIIAVLMGLFILAVASFIMMSIDNLLILSQSKPWIGPFINHTTMMAISIIVMLILSKGKISIYGFKIGENVQLKQIALVSLGIGIIGALIQSSLPGKSLAFIEKYSFLQVVIVIWIYASICEEVLTRGLIQGYLMPLTKYGFAVFKLRISVPVLVGALFFASMHIMLLTMGIATFTVITIVLFALILGIIAGYHREKTGSIIPAIIVHILFNLGGSFTGFIIGLLRGN